MNRYDQAWCDALSTSASTSAIDGALEVLYVVTEAEGGKHAFSIKFEGGSVTATHGKLPRGHKPDVTVTAKEAALLALWSGDRSRDVAFMRGDLKIEGAYARWLDELVPLFETQPWVESWQAAAS